MKSCRDCGRDMPDEALVCPRCGSEERREESREGLGFEYRSRATLLGLPLVHVSFRFGRGMRPLPAKGIVAVGHFACGVFTLSQFGIGLVSVGQVVVAGYALAQVAAAYALLAQVGIYLSAGQGQVVRSLGELAALLGAG